MRLVHSHAISHHGVQYQNHSSISTGDIKKGIIIWGLEPPSPYIPGGNFFYIQKEDWSIATTVENFNFLAPLILKMDRDLKIWGLNPTGAIVGVQNWVI